MIHLRLTYPQLSVKELRPSTAMLPRINYQLPKGCNHPEVDILSVAGRVVRRLTQSGRFWIQNSVFWDGLDQTGHPLPPGVYIVRLKSGNLAKTQKVVVTR